MSINSDPHIHENVICANVFVRKDGKYLLLKRSAHKKFLPNYINPIGGKVEKDENPYLATIEYNKKGEVEKMSKSINICALP